MSTSETERLRQENAQLRQSQGDDELERLRRENEQLRQRQRQFQQQSQQGQQQLQQQGQQPASLMMGQPSSFVGQQQPPTFGQQGAMAPFRRRPVGRRRRPSTTQLGFFDDSFTRDVEEALDEVWGWDNQMDPFMMPMQMMRMPVMDFGDTKRKIAMVQRCCEEKLDEELGSGCKCEHPVQHFHSTSTVDGKTTENLQMVCRCTNPQTGDCCNCACSASIVDGEVTLGNLSLDTSKRIV